jgi:hypothetical protein
MAILLVTHLAILVVVRAKCKKCSNSFRLGFLFSFAGSIWFVVDWFNKAEYGGPVAAGLAIIIAPFVIPVFMLIFYFLGWSLSRLTSMAIAFAMHHDSESKITKKQGLAAVLILLSTTFIILLYAGVFIKNDYGLIALPEDNFTNSTGLKMIKTSQGYWVSAYETTQLQFQSIMGYNPSKKGDDTPSRYLGDDIPVHTLITQEAIDFCDKLTQVEDNNQVLPNGYHYTLPSYEQWLEYVADAQLEGSVTPGAYLSGELRSPLPVGAGEVNRLGIFDLRGSVAEYCLPENNVGHFFVVGGSWCTSSKEFLSVKNRGFANRNFASCHVGFRVVLAKVEKIRN